ncbi:G-patch-domain Zn-finger DNA-binding protein [Desarmillaria tabescens]|uniref:G-patch-domain Zn-finger DNA-binding protein n=1 Tax=Armillaria tabescens TaxID=1929756 RepID=A0AA39T554_ARMTA|nr:G-patch-domain Zn-finger DNA-binding protein [Desarmillaria tabescens]KAK0465341.1 G-patch-domain Zn-finger DNA-binding protein [Desarmillaria tabescens]
MDVDEDIHKYGEYVRGAPREVITVETKIKPTNKGFAMLSKLGWSEGQPLGISGDGRVDPIPFQMKADFTGVGKINQDVRMIETTVSQRRELDSERQHKETEDQRRARQDDAARRSALANELVDTLKPFYCSLCDKQFKNVTQYDEHTNSYAHHHKARFRDMQANVRIKPQDEVDKRKEKERKREERELRKIAAANGVKMTKSLSLVTATSPDSGDSASQPSIPHITSGNAQSGFKKSGWATIGSSSLPPQPPPTEPHSSATVTNGHPPSLEEQGAPSKGGWRLIPPASASVSLSSADHSQHPLMANPDSPTPPAPSSASNDPAKPSKAQASRAGWQQFQKSNQRRK